MAVKDAFGLFLLITLAIYHFKPQIMFQDETPRPFGIGYLNNVQKTLFTMSNVTILVAILCFYLVN